MTQSRFEDLGISKDVLKAVRSVGWSEPTPVQAAAIPVGLEGADLLAQAQTGTGKTGTFGSIILSRTKSGSSDPTSLVLVPTRELASQVSEEMERLSEYSGHVCIPIYGGVNIETQAKQLKKGADAVIATPGRLKDLIERKMIKLDSVEIVVLDEAARMLDMGSGTAIGVPLMTYNRRAGARNLTLWPLPGWMKGRPGRSGWRISGQGRPLRRVAPAMPSKCA